MIAQPPIQAVSEAPSFQPSPTGRNGHRELPNSPEAEEHSLSACLLDPSDILPRAIMLGLTPSSFYAPPNVTIFSCILDMYAHQKPIAIDTLAEELRRTRQLDHAGGIPYLTQISGRMPTTLQAGYFLEKVREQATLRELIRAATLVTEDCYEFGGELNELLAKVQDNVSKAINGHSGNADEESVQTVATRLLEDLAAPKSKRTGVAGEISWALIDVDRGCGKLAPGTLNILAGMPSTGKSAWSDQIAWKAVCDGRHIAIFSYEMTKRDKVVRMAQQESRLNMDQFDDAPMDRKIAFTSAVRRIEAAKGLHIFERDTTVQRITARVRALHQRHPVGLIVIDFLQYLARFEPTIGKERTDERIGRITGSMKALAKECDCPVLLLSSLNRTGYADKETKNTRPGLAALRNSGEIESDADVVMILHWPKTNPRTGHEQDPREDGQSEFYVEAAQEKGRNRGVHLVPVQFSRTATRFDCLMH